jgi:ferredoxin-NADP reductase
MDIYHTELIRKCEIIKDTFVFHFEKPEGFAFTPGQFVELTIPNPAFTDNGGSTRPFSIASSPGEANLMIATRITPSAFKRSLASLEPGAEAHITQPFGSFVLHSNPVKPAVFLTAGIGITPFRSMVRHAVEAKLPHVISLFFGNRNPGSAPFLAELEELAVGGGSYTFIPIMSDADLALGNWGGERGVITADLVKRYVDKTLGPIYYIAGPQAMVASVWQSLVAAGVDRDDIRTEEFPGY